MQDTRLFGEYEQDWDAFTLTPWCHPAGSRLGWHTDLLDSGPTRVGAFTWYLNDDWDYDWGGHLQIIDRDHSDVEMVSQASWKGKTPSVSSSIPDVIPPRANRFVAFKSGTWHSVSRVDLTAGDRMRRSIVGFFIKT
ncbi:Hypothetical protein CGLY_16550 (plasmid) [Corynebacterium glyciniphilum AJ 3170]|uniref:Prolyl 4-hydroxylase alpha subunit Fe(2+) 2OG dioxygenase domain-containing protein n=1 Tax=Corynebacterium glyciniphilum AJ 3170 TaxID=1404245 RepID=X5DR45_9CORY|nr:Hypothetical protein CGLY_16550 [Corynebacterium glyciniphilum AJ 3170]